MNKLAKKKFVKDLCDSIRDRLVDQIDADKIPERWDGHELRFLLKDLFDQASQISVLRSYPKGERAKDYRNTIQITNIL